MLKALREIVQKHQKRSEPPTGGAHRGSPKGEDRRPGTQADIEMRRVLSLVQSGAFSSVTTHLLVIEYLHFLI